MPPRRARQPPPSPGSRQWASASSMTPRHSRGTQTPRGVPPPAAPASSPPLRIPRPKPPTPVAPTAAAAPFEGFDAIDDMALFERVLTQASRDHERRKSRGMSTPQRTQTSAGRGGANQSQDTNATPTARPRQERGRGNVAGSSTSTPIARSRLRPAPAVSSPPEDDLDLPSLDDSQFQTYDARATPQREGSAESYVSEDSLPSVGDSQFAASPQDPRQTVSQASPNATVRPSSARRPHRVVEDEDEDESLPAVDDSQFEPSMPAASTSALAPPAEVGRRVTRRQASRPLASADATTQRRTRSAATQSQSQSIPDSLPSPDDSQFEQSAPAPSARVTRSRAPQHEPAIADIREEPDESQQAFDLSDDDDLPAINDSQFEQTQTQRPVPAPRLRGESAELAAAEEFLLPITPVDTDNEDTAGGHARPDAEPESDPKSSAQESVVVVVEAQRTMAVTEDVRVEPADVTGTAAEPIDVEREPETALPRQTEAAPQSTPRGTAQQPVIIDDEPVQRTPRATRPSADPRSSIPSTSAATLAQPSPSQFRRQSRREDPTEFAPPDDTDLTEVERRGEEPMVMEPEHPLHGPRKPRRSSVSRRPAAAPPSQQTPARVVQTVSVAQQTETVDEEAAFEEELLLEMDRDRSSAIGHRIHDAEDEDSANDERRQRRNSRHSSHLDPASAPLQIASQRRQDTPQPPDPFMFDADGSPLRVRWGYMVPPDYTAPKSRIHGQREGQAFKYSRLIGQRMRWTKEQTLLLYRTVQKVPLRVENPMDVVMYLYGEFGVRSQDLAFYNKQHMRSRMVTVVETRMRNKLPIEGRARMFLPPREPRRLDYEKELKAFRVKDQAERLAIKEEMEEARAAAQEEDVSDFSDERDDEDAAGYDHAGDYSSDRARGGRFRDDEDMSEDEDERTPPRRQKRKTPYVEIVRRRPHPPPRKRRHLDASSDRDRDEPRANRRRLAQEPDDSDSDWEEPRYYRRRHADFVDTPAFTLDAAPTPPPQSPPSSPMAAARRRQSAPGRLAGGGPRGPRASRPSAFDQIMEEEESEQEWEGYGPPPGGPAPGFYSEDYYPDSEDMSNMENLDEMDEEDELDDQDAVEAQPPRSPPARRQTRASDRVPVAQPEPAEEQAPEDEDEDMATPNPPPPARPSPPRRQTRASTRASTRATTRASAPVADTQPGRRITRSSARRESEELPPPAASAPAGSALRVRTYGKRGRGRVVTEEQAEADAEEQVNAEAAAQGEEEAVGDDEDEHQEQEEDEDMKEDDDGDDDGEDAEGESELEEGAGEDADAVEDEGEDETQDASLVVRRELVRQKVLRGG